MKKRIYKLVAVFPGILVPTYSEEEYRRKIASEEKLLPLIMCTCALCATGGLFFIILALLVITG